MSGADMSDERKITFLGSIKNLFIPRRKNESVLKEPALLLGWIAVIILMAALSWFLTQPLRSRLFQRAVNRALEQSNVPERLGEPIQNGALSFGIGGNYFYMGISAESTAYIFTLIGEGSFFPCLALINREGIVEEIIPLGLHAQRMIKRISPGTLAIYARRIEGSIP